MAPSKSFLRSTLNTRTANALCPHNFQAISATRSLCTLPDCTATRTHPGPDAAAAAAAKTTPVSGAFVAQPIRPNPVLCQQRNFLIALYEDATVPGNLSERKAEEALDNLIQVADRVGEDDGLLPELSTPAPRDKIRALMGPRDAARVRKMRKAARPSLSTCAKMEFAMMKAAVTRRTEWVATEDGFTWAVREGQMRTASRLRNEVRSEEVVEEEDEMIFEDVMFDEDVEMYDVMDEDNAEYDLQEEIQEDFQEDFQEEIQEGVQEDVREDFREYAPEHIEDDIEHDIEDDNEDDAEDIIKEDVQGDIQDNNEDIEDDIKDDVQDDIEDIEDEIKVDIQEDVQENDQEDVQDDIQGDNANIKIEDEGDEEEEQEEEVVIPAYIDRRATRYNLRPRVAVDYRCAYKYAYAK